MKAPHELPYRTITGRTFDLKGLTKDERHFLLAVLHKYRPQTGWSRFAAWWLEAFPKSGLSDKSVVYRICQDLEARLGIEQGKVSPPDYRDCLADLIEERYGSRYRFCKKTGIDPGHLSRVLGGKADFSVETLRTLLVPLHAVMVLQPVRTVQTYSRPMEASRAQIYVSLRG
jgi:hypothetical protein